ncbi:MAG: cobalamin B12-binding domain-containing protein, partial [Anaerovoracaceae bacterium]
EKFYEILDKMDKKEAVDYCLYLLETDKIDVITMYTELLTPALNNISCKLDNPHLCIWEEHIRTGIVRTILECSYPYVIKSRETQNKETKLTGGDTAVVLCPPEELHDLGAKMIADYLCILGYETVYAGSNMPYDDFINGIIAVRPKIIALSVSNFYNLVVTKKIIKDIREKTGNETKIIVGGNAFSGKGNNAESVGADFYAASIEDIKVGIDYLKKETDLRGVK